MGKVPKLSLISAEIREIIKLFNSFAYIKTTSSCAGYPLCKSAKKEMKPYVEYKALNYKAYDLTKNLVDEVNNRQSKSKNENDIFSPYAELYPNNMVIFTTHQEPVLNKKENIEGLLLFWNYVESALRGYSKFRE